MPDLQSAMWCRVNGLPRNRCRPLVIDASHRARFEARLGSGELLGAGLKIEGEAVFALTKYDDFGARRGPLPNVETVPSGGRRQLRWRHTYRMPIKPDVAPRNQDNAEFGRWGSATVRSNLRLDAARAFGPSCRAVRCFLETRQSR